MTRRTPRQRVFHSLLLLTTFSLFCIDHSSGDCGEPLPVPYAYRQWEGGEIGAWANYSCYHGYLYTGGTLLRQCMSTGNYSGTPPECALNCGEVPRIPGTVVEWSGQEKARIASYSCDVNLTKYATNNENTIHHNVTCNSNYAHWNRPLIFCSDEFDLSAKGNATQSTVESVLALPEALYVTFDAVTLTFDNKAAALLQNYTYDSNKPYFFGADTFTAETVEVNLTGLLANTSDVTSAVHHVTITEVVDWLAGQELGHVKVTLSGQLLTLSNGVLHLWPDTGQEGTGITTQTSVFSTTVSQKAIASPTGTDVIDSASPVFAESSSQPGAGSMTAVDSSQMSTSPSSPLRVNSESTLTASEMSLSYTSQLELGSESTIATSEMTTISATQVRLSGVSGLTTSEIAPSSTSLLDYGSGSPSTPSSVEEATGKTTATNYNSGVLSTIDPSASYGGTTDASASTNESEAFPGNVSGTSIPTMADRYPTRKGFKLHLAFMVLKLREVPVVMENTTHALLNGTAVLHNVTWCVFNWTSADVIATSVDLKGVKMTLCDAHIALSNGDVIALDLPLNVTGASLVLHNAQTEWVQGAVTSLSDDFLSAQRPLVTNGGNLQLWSGGCSSTQREWSPWWKVKLDQSYVIGVVKFQLADTADATYIVNITIQVWGQDFGTQTCKKIPRATLTTPETIVCKQNFKGPPIGSEVKVTADFELLPGRLQICDIRVYGRPVEVDCAQPLVVPGASYSVGNTTLGCSASYVCEKGFDYTGGDPVSTCPTSWTHPKISCTDRKSGIISVASNDILLDGSSHTCVFPLNESTWSVDLGYLVEVKALTIYIEDFSSLVVDGLTVWLGQGQGAKPCSGGSTTLQSAVSSISCPTRPVGRLVTLTFNLASSRNASLCEVKVVGRRFMGGMECIETSRGGEYKGDVNFTMSGLPCLPWSAFSLQVSGFPDRTLDEAGNSCRNPDTRQRRPWCYVNGTQTDGSQAWELCPIPPCSAICRVREDGFDYAGTFAWTDSGAQCRNWRYSGFMLLRDFPDMAHYSFCRNPGRSQTEPWCYTAGGDNSVEHCTIPYCPTEFQKYDILWNETAAVGNPRECNLFYHSAHHKAYHSTHHRHFAEAWLYRCETDQSTAVAMFCHYGASANATWKYFIIACPPIQETTTQIDVTTATAFSTDSSSPEGTSEQSTTLQATTPEQATSEATASQETTHRETTLENTTPLATRVEATTPQPSKNKPKSLCSCRCMQRKTDLSSSLHSVTASLVQKLTVPKANLSSERRRLTSASDTRPSAVAVGSLGIVMMVVVFAPFVLTDVVSAVAALVRFFMRSQALSQARRQHVEDDRPVD